MKTPAQVAAKTAAKDGTGYGAIDAAIERGDIRLRDIRALIADGITADRAQRFDVPMPLAGVITATNGGVFVNRHGDVLVEPVGNGLLDESPELILVTHLGNTATLRGDWETGWEA